MERHVKNYLKAFGFSGIEFIPCESCGNSAVDIHHIHPRSFFGSKRKDSCSYLDMEVLGFQEEKGKDMTPEEYIAKKHETSVSNILNDGGRYVLNAHEVRSLMVEYAEDYHKAKMKQLEDFTESNKSAWRPTNK